MSSSRRHYVLSTRRFYIPALLKWIGRETHTCLLKARVIPEARAHSASPSAKALKASKLMNSASSSSSSRWACTAWQAASSVVQRSRPRGLQIDDEEDLTVKVAKNFLVSNALLSSEHGRPSEIDQSMPRWHKARRRIATLSKFLAAHSCPSR